MTFRLYFLVGILAALPALAQQPPARLNPVVQKIVASISEERIAATLKKLESFENRFVMSERDHPTRGIGAAERWIESEFKSYSPRLRVSLHKFKLEKGPRIPREAEANNVVALLPGTVHKDKYIVVSGHYDTLAFIAKKPETVEERVAKLVKDGMEEAEAKQFVALTPADEVRPPSDIEKMSSPGQMAPGVNDDGSGTAAVMELARVMSGYEFDKSILFIAFAGEEVGLVGSRAYAKEAKAKKMQIEALLNNDIIGTETGGNGRSASSHVRVFSAGPEDSLPRALAVYTKEIAERYVPSMTVDLVLRQDRFRRGGDHTPFAQAGFAAVRVTSAVENYSQQHTTADVFSAMSVPYNTRVAKINAAVAASLALAPTPPVIAWEVKTGKTAGSRSGFLSRGKGGYDARARWVASPDPDVAGYSVLVRSTTSPLWEREIYVGSVTEFSLPDVSIDDVAIGVRAIDKDGNQSLVATYTLDAPAPSSGVPAEKPAGAASSAAAQ